MRGSLPFVAGPRGWPAGLHYQAVQVQHPAPETGQQSAYIGRVALHHLCDRTGMCRGQQLRFSAAPAHASANPAPSSAAPAQQAAALKFPHGNAAAALVGRRKPTLMAAAAAATTTTVSASIGGQKAAGWSHEGATRHGHAA